MTISIPAGGWADPTQHRVMKQIETAANSAAALGATVSTLDATVAALDATVTALAATVASQAVTLMPPVAATGTFVDFTGIPATAKQITVMFNHISTNGTSIIQVQLGDVDGIETSGYVAINQSGATVTVGTSGFILNNASAAADLHTGCLILSLCDAATFRWVATGTFNRNNSPAVYSLTGIKATSAVTDRIRVTTVNGTDAFDAGSVSISYQG